MKKKTLVVVLTLAFLFPVHLIASAENHYKEAWKEFLQNNRTEARKLFTQALNDEKTKADAYLGLCIMDWNESKEESAFENLKKFYHASSEPDAYLYALYSTPFSFASADVQEKKKIDFLEEMVGKVKNGTLKTMIYETLGMHYQASKEFDKANELFAKTGAMRHFQVLGTFSNVSGSGFDKEWGALQKAREKDIFENQYGAPIAWCSPGENKENGWFDFTYYYSLEGVIVYAQTFVTSPEEQEVYLRTGTSGSLKIWVNDALVTSVKKERNCDLDIYGSKIRLNKGANRILLQLGQSDVSALNFMLRITDANGDPINGLTEQAEYTKYTKSTAPASNNLLPFFAEYFLEEKVKGDKENPLNYLLLAETLLRNDKSDEAIELLKELQQHSPQSSFIHYRLAEAYMRAQNQTFSTREIENLKKESPDSFHALDILVGEAISSNKITEVKNLCRKMKELYGESLTTRGIDSWLADKQNDQEEYIAIAKGNYEKRPWIYSYMHTVFNIEENVLKNSKGATAVVEEYCSKYFNASALDLLSNRYIKEGNTEKGLQILRERIERVPYATGFQQSYANTLYRMQRYEEALEITDRLLKSRPTSSYTHSLRAGIYKAMKDTKRAVEEYKKAILYSPSDFESRTQLRQLEGKKEIDELFPRFNLDSLIAASPSQSDYPDDNSIILLYDTKLQFHAENSTEYHMELAVKILNQSGVEMWKEYSIPYYQNQQLIVDKSEVIKENGQRVKAERNGGHVVFTNLEIGNTFYLEYRIKDYSTDALSKHFSDQWIFQYAVPTSVVSYSILAPKEKKFSYEVANGELKPLISNVEDMKLYRWVLTDQPAVRIEPVMSSFLDVTPTLSYSSIPNWEFVSNWYRDLTANKFEDDYLLRQTVDEILKGNENASPLAKAKLFYDYIMKNITYSNVPFMQNNFIPQKASRTISTRLGDCKDVSTLFVAMCRKLGIEANLVLVLTRDNGRNILPLPAVGFNHCIAQLKVDGKSYYLELTDNKLPFGAVLEMDLYSPILPIPFGDEKAVGKLVSMDMPFRLPNNIRRTSELSFVENDLLIKTTNVRSGASASGIRHIYADMGSEDQLKQMTQIIASDYKTPIKVTNLTFDDLNCYADTAVYSYEIEAKNLVQEVAGMKLFTIRWSDAIRSLEEFSLETRKYPFELWMYMMEESLSEVITIQIPEGKKLIEIPENVHLECANMVYDLTFSMNSSNVLIGKRSMIRKAEVVTPEEYAEFRTFMQAVIERDTKQYVFK